MKYDASFFDTHYDRRNTQAIKWDIPAKVLRKEINPMWVADMDFPCPQEVTDALIARASHRVYGYSTQSKSAVSAMLAFMRRRHHIEFTPGEQIMLPCVVSGLRAAVLAYTEPGDKIIVQPPIYPPFYASTVDNGRELAKCPLLKDEKGYYTMDLQSVEDACKQGAKMMILCNPHNPVGRCWTAQELQNLVDLLARYNVLLVSDEIHEDIIMAPFRFTPVLSLNLPENAKVIAMTSISKTFNLAGLQQATAFCRDAELLARLKATMHNVGIEEGNIFAMTAFEAAYTYGDDWLDGLLAYLKDGEALFRKALTEKLPKAVLSPLEATYLGWIDLTAYGLTSDELTERCRREGVEFNGGAMFGADGFLRVNYACPHDRILQAADQLAAALSE